MNIDYQNSIISSQVLGDGSLQGRRLVIYHGINQEEYVHWKKQLFESIGFSTTEIKYRSRNSTFGQQTIVGFTTSNDQIVTFNHCTPVQLVSMLEPLGLLLWWLDDGSMNIHEKRNGVSVSRSGHLNTHRFIYTVQQQIAQCLVDKFQLYTKIHLDSGKKIDGTIRIPYYRLYLNAMALRNLIDHVRDYIQFVPSSMLYKLDMDYRPTRLKTSLAYATNYNFK